MAEPKRRWRPLTWCCLVIALVAASPPSGAQTPADEALNEIEARLAARYQRLEILAARLAELSSSTQPRRAELLQQLVAAGRERGVVDQFDEIIRLLESGGYSTAINGQNDLQQDLEYLLELLLQEDRDRRIESERKRVLRYLQQLNRAIRMQRGVRARTEGGDDADELAGDQRRVTENVAELEEDIEEAEGASGSESETSAGESGAETPASDPGDGSSRPEDESSDAGDETPDAGDDPPRDGDPSEGQPAGGQPTEGQPAEGQPTEGQPAEGQPAEGEPSNSDTPSGDQPSGGQPSGGQPSQGSGESDAEQPPSSPMERAAENLRRARQRMEQAQKRLEDAERRGAVEEQERAIEDLQAAKAELERILRQLREEELERMLVLLEARFRKMLDEQVAVYEATQKLAESSEATPAHELEIGAGRLSRREGQIVREADRALVLLREDGTSVAFPEAVEQARDDMQQITDRLAQVQTGLITQTLEEDVIAALEETLAALQKALDDIRDQQAQPPPGGGGGGAPGEQPLVDQLAELRMIRSLQQRVNRRTEQYGALVEGEQAFEEELLELLDELALRQARIFQATRDLDTGANR